MCKKGKEEPVSIYEALDALPNEQLKSILQCQPNFEEALDSYLDQQWEQSKSYFKIYRLCVQMTVSFKFILKDVNILRTIHHLRIGTVSGQ